MTLNMNSILTCDEHGFRVENIATGGYTQEYHLPVKKKRGRPKMEETFFYDPYERWVISVSYTGVVIPGQRKGIWL